MLPFNIVNVICSGICVWISVPFICLSIQVAERSFNYRGFILYLNVWWTSLAETYNTCLFCSVYCLFALVINYCVRITTNFSTLKQHSFIFLVSVSQEFGHFSGFLCSGSQEIRIKVLLGCSLIWKSRFLLTKPPSNF